MHISTNHKILYKVSYTHITVCFYTLFVENVNTKHNIIGWGLYHP